MSSQVKHLLALDVGEKRIGVAHADMSVRIASPLLTLEVDGTELEKIDKLLHEYLPEEIVVGYPRNQSGAPTEQTKVVERFAQQLQALGLPIVFQDESLTSVLAEERLRHWGKPYTKADIDAQAASIILHDYVEANYGY